MTIINDSANFELYQLCNHYDDLYFEDTQFFAHRYSNSVVLVDLENAMKAGKTCTRYLFRVNLWEMEAERLCITEYLEMAFPECSTLAEMFQHLRNGAPLEDVAGLSVEISTQAGNRTFSPFATVKPQKLGERLNASGIAKAILAGQIVAGRTDGRYTDDYAMDAAYDFYKGDIDLQHFASDIYEHPSGWRFWWKDNDHTEIVAACHTFDYKTLVVA